MTLHSLRQVADRAVAMYRTRSPGERPDLVDLGLESLRKTVGGVAPGNIVCIGAATNVGKTSIALEMLLHSQHRGVLLSREDDADLLGVRLLAREAGVRDVRIRTNLLDPEERARVVAAQERLAETGPLFAMPKDCYDLDRVEAVLEEAAELGARWALLDFIQKYRGVSNDRRAEVGIVMDRYQTKCRECGLVPVFTSQFARISPFTRPQLTNLKESGDLENECKLVLLAHRNPVRPSQVIVDVAKSSFGGGGTMFSMKYDECGVLREEGLIQADEFSSDEELPI